MTTKSMILKLLFLIFLLSPSKEENKIPKKANYSMSGI